MNESPPGGGFHRHGLGSIEGKRSCQQGSRSDRSSLGGGAVSLLSSEASGQRPIHRHATWGTVMSKGTSNCKGWAAGEKSKGFGVRRCRVLILTPLRSVTLANRLTLQPSVLSPGKAVLPPG